MNFAQKKKMKGKGGSVNAAKAKKIVKESTKRVSGTLNNTTQPKHSKLIQNVFFCSQEFVKNVKGVKESIFKAHKSTTSSDDFLPLEQSQPKDDGPKSVLDRFKPKVRKTNR